MHLSGWEAMMLSNLIRQFHFYETVGPSKWTLRLVSSFVTVLLLVVVAVALLRLLHLLQSLQLEDITLQTLVEVVKRVGLELLLHHRHRDVRQLDIHLHWQDWMRKQLENDIKLSFWFEDRRSKPKLKTFDLGAKFYSGGKTISDVVAHLKHIKWTSCSLWSMTIDTEESETFAWRARLSKYKTPIFLSELIL